jgi:hypothetical protein
MYLESTGRIARPIRLEESGKTGGTIPELALIIAASPLDTKVRKRQ